jgi:hypothetical protein
MSVEQSISNGRRQAMENYVDFSGSKRNAMGQDTKNTKIITAYVLSGLGLAAGIGGIFYAHKKGYGGWGKFGMFILFGLPFSITSTILSMSANNKVKDEMLSNGMMRTTVTDMLVKCYGNASERKKAMNVLNSLSLAEMNTTLENDDFGSLLNNLPNSQPTCY